MPLVTKDTVSTTATGLPVDEHDQAAIGTPGSDAALANVRSSDAAGHTEAHRGGEAVVPERSRAERARGFTADAFPVPTGREEQWRFTPMDRLRGLADAAPFDTDGVRLTPSLPEGVRVERVARDDAARPGSGMVPGHRVSARAWEAAQEVTLVTIPDEAEIDAAVRLDVVGLRSETASAGHIVVHAGRHSRATVVLAFSGSATAADNVEISLEDGAQLRFVTLQEWDDDAVHLSSQHARIGRDAELKHIAVTLGGQVVRLDIDAEYSGPGGSFDGFGVYFADSGQDLEQRLFVDHAVPRCRSNVEYKGALAGEGAHTVWIGDVLIRAAAEGTDTYELNRNLVLTDGARADSVPNLEIETGDIAGAGHASTTGRFDDEQLFYLRSRGIPEDDARRLVVRGFFADVVNRIGVPEVVDHLMERIDAELGATGGGALAQVITEETR